MQDNLREELIKQFPAEVVELVEPSGKKFYACPTCKRVVTLNESKCAGLQPGIELGSHPAGRDGEGCEDGNLKI